MNSGPLRMQSLVGRSLGRSNVHPSHKYIWFYFSTNLKHMYEYFLGQKMAANLDFEPFGDK